MSVALHISGTIYHMILIYGTHECEVVISPGDFLFFRLLGGKRAKNSSK